MYTGLNILLLLNNMKLMYPNA